MVCDSGASCVVSNLFAHEINILRELQHSRNRGRTRWVKSATESGMRSSAHLWTRPPVVQTGLDHRVCATRDPVGCNSAIWVSGCQRQGPCVRCRRLPPRQYVSRPDLCSGVGSRCGRGVAGPFRALGRARFTADADYVSFDGSRRGPRPDGRRTRSAVPRGPGGIVPGGRGRIRAAAVPGRRRRPRDRLGPHARPSRLPRRRLSRQTMVAVLTAQGWRFTAMHNGRVRPLRIPTPDFLPTPAPMCSLATAGHSGLEQTGAGPAPP
jgi:hypothetical protein